jgi:ribose 5-phosphate isomerase A
MANCDPKQMVGLEISRRIRSGDTIGIGAGTTVLWAIKSIANRIASERLELNAVVASHETEGACIDAGIRVRVPYGTKIDWGFDGADEVSPNLDLLKGSGGMMLRERIVDSMVDRLVIIIDESKLVEQLGQKHPVPLEVIPTARQFVERRLHDLGAWQTQVRRSRESGTFVLTEQGNLIIDANFSGIVRGMHAQLKSIPGVVETGLFEDLCTEVIVGTPSGVWVLQKNGTGIVKTKPTVARSLQFHEAQ